MGTITTAIVYSAQYTSAGCVPDRNGNGGGNYTTCVPDYAKQDAFAGYIDAWAALPSRADGADIVPAWCGVDAQSTAEVDTFFVPPTAYFGDKQNGNWDDGTAGLMTELGLIVTAAAFNGAAAIYAPRYRQAGQSAQDGWKNFNWQPPPAGDAAAATTDAAMRLAYADVSAAFSNFSAASDRPFILAAHSQGTLHLKELIRSLPRELREERLVAAYLVGNTVEEGELPLPVCATADATGCFVSWNSVVEGGTAGRHWINKTADGTGAGTPVCVNPLTWEYGDTAPAPRSLNRGSVPLLGHLFLSHLDAEVAGARCGADGILYVDLAPDAGWGYSVIEGPGTGRLHAYDVQLWWASVRQNARVRAAAFLGRGAPPPEACPPCGENAACVFGLLSHGLVAAILLYLLVVLLLAPCCCAAFCIGRRRSDGGWPEFALAVACCSCCPCYALVVLARRRRRRKAPAMRVGDDPPVL